MGVFFHGMEEVVSSNLTRSTKSLYTFLPCYATNERTRVLFVLFSRPLQA